MALTINTNVASFSAQTNLSKATQALGKTFERLSSGLRIVSASDDPAGLAIADKIRADTRIASQAIRNSNDGISLVSIADGALEEVSNVLTRMAELAEQASNGTLANSQRSALESEFESLGSEVQRIAKSTEYNDRKLLYQSSDIQLQVGLDSSSSSQITISSVLGTLSSLGLNSDDSTDRLDYQLLGATSVVAQTNATLALDAVQSAISTVALSRGTLGAAESRLSVAVSNLQNLRENLTTAESQIRDVDVAKEAAELVRLQILQQGAAAVLAQANQQPAVALTLLS